MIFSVVIPTKNRHKDLIELLETIEKQTIVPLEVIIVDQSNDPLDMSKIKGTIPNIFSLVRYMHEPTVTGLVHAKDFGMKRSKGELIFFIDDDILLKEDFFEQIVAAFKDNDKMMGCCGVTVNDKLSSSIGKNIAYMFRRGIYYDARLNSKNKNLKIYLSKSICGGLTAYKSKVFNSVELDYDFFSLEDMDFSDRVWRAYNGGLYVNKNAQAFHKMSGLININRYFRNNWKETILYYKKRRHINSSKTDFQFMAAFYLLSAIKLSIRNFSLCYLVSFFKEFKKINY